MSKDVLHTYSFKPWYNNRLTVHVYTIAKIMLNSLHLLKFHSQACLTSRGAWVVFKCLQLAWSNRQLYKTGETGHLYSCIL